MNFGRAVNAMLDGHFVSMWPEKKVKDLYLFIKDKQIYVHYINNNEELWRAPSREVVSDQWFVVRQAKEVLFGSLEPGEKFVLRKCDVEDGTPNQVVKVGDETKALNLCSYCVMPVRSDMLVYKWEGKNGEAEIKTTKVDLPNKEG